jgi:hypothetical protein
LGAKRQPAALEREAGDGEAIERHAGAAPEQRERTVASERAIERQDKVAHQPTRQRPACARLAGESQRAIAGLHQRQPRERQRGGSGAVLGHCHARHGAAVAGARPPPRE